MLSIAGLREKGPGGWDVDEKSSEFSKDDYLIFKNFDTMVRNMKLEQIKK